MHQTVYHRCLICAGLWNTFKTSGDGKEYYRCSRCGYTYLHPGFHPGESEERDRYLKHNNSPENSGYVDHLTKIIDRWIVPDSVPGSHILDFGSGPVPVFAHLLEKRGFQTAVFDPFFAPQYDNLEKKYHRITLIEVIEHLENPLSILKKLKNLLSEGSSMIISTHLYTEATDFSSWWYRNDLTHRGFFSERTFSCISQLLSLSHCRIDEGRIITLTR